MAISGDTPESLLGSLEIGRRTIKKAKARIGARDHRGQRLPDLVSNRGGDGVSGHQARLSFPTLTQHRGEEPPYIAVISYSKTTRTMLLDSKLVTRTAYQPVLKRAGNGK